jgi:hypothetical protein
LDLAKYLGEGTSLRKAGAKASAFLFLYLMFPRFAADGIYGRLTKSGIRPSLNSPKFVNQPLRALLVTVWRATEDT